MRMRTPTPIPHGDPREATYRSRLQIGFHGLRDAWSAAPAVFTQDTLMIEGHPVMERWEDGYMRTLAGIAARKGGRVLEVGFGMGISSTHLQESGISEHIIIEANEAVHGRAAAFAAKAKVPSKALYGFWEDIASALPSNSMDGILFDTYPLASEEVHQNHFSFFEEAYRLLRRGGVLTYYSDEIDSFSHPHLYRLRSAGFKKIGGVVCPVNPPADCGYWTSKTILAPIVIK